MRPLSVEDITRAIKSTYSPYLADLLSPILAVEFRMTKIVPAGSKVWPIKGIRPRRQWPCKPVTLNRDSIITNGVLPDGPQFSKFWGIDKLKYGVSWFITLPREKGDPKKVYTIGFIYRVSDVRSKI